MKKMMVYILFVLSVVSTSCKKNVDSSITPEGVNNAADVFPAPPAKWFGGAAPHFVPAGFVGDVMPYYDKDSFHIFYLHDARDGASGFHPWSKFTTRDFTSYMYDGIMIPYGSTSDYDDALGTGSIVKVGNTYYAYYSSFNNSFTGTGGKYRDNILLATSTDLDNWQKVPSFIIKPETTNGYNFWEFRDPYVFFNTEKNEYWMLVCGQLNGQAAVMLYTTKDPAANNWQLQPPAYTTGAYKVAETPQMFKWGNYWYLLFSENSVESVTRYRYATSSSGPWTTPANDKLDGTYMYAGKAASDGSNTYLFGWCATKAGCTDNGPRDFGGNLIVHQLAQNDDGTLNVMAASSITRPFSQKQELNLVLKAAGIGYQNNNVTFTSNETDQFLVYSRIAGERLITGTISNIQPGAEFGFVFGMDNEVQNTNYYKINFSEANDVVNGMAVTGGAGQTDGKVNIALEAAKEYTFKMVIDGSVCVLYINDKVALTSRIYSLQNNLWGLFASKGGVEFKNLQVFGL